MPETRSIDSNDITYSYDVLTTLQTCSTTIPWDDTIPQNTEGTQVLSASITTTKSTSKILVMVSLYGVAPTGGSFWTTAVFKDSGADAIAAFSERVNEVLIKSYQFIDSPGASGTYTYKVRTGSNSGSVYLNGHGAGARDFGGVSKCTLTLVRL